MEKLAELAEMSAGHLSRIERHEKGWSMESLPKLARALGVELYQLIDASEAWQDVPVIGAVGQAVMGRILHQNCSNDAAKQKVKVPAVFGDVIAVSAVGSSLYPRYNTGDVIIASEPSITPAEAAGRECVVITDDERVAIKFVQNTSDGGNTIATSHNEPPLSDLRIMRCYPIVYVVR